ncbi:MAG: hypothetical protein GY705_31035 [Bacteroidetes bacterium]|nr:hypothetical protein [Bacteroidota bacterium]
MNKLFFLFAILFYSSNVLIAQDDTTKQVYPEIERNYLKISVVDLFDPTTPSLQLAFEQSISSRYSLALGGGIIHTFNGRWMNRKELTGYRLRGEIRRLGTIDRKKHYGIQLMFKQYSEHLEREVSRSDGTYWQQLAYSENTLSGAIHLFWGKIRPLSNQMFYEVGLGSGLRFWKTSLKDLPEDATPLLVNTGFFQGLDNVFGLPSIVLSLRLGFVLNQSSRFP